MTLGPDADSRDDGTLLLQEPTDYNIVNLQELGSTTSASEVAFQDPVPAEEPSNELLESLLALPDDENVSDAEADIPALEDHPSAEGDYLSPSDTVTTASGSSIASPPAYDEKSVRFELPADSANSLNYLQADHRLSSIFLPGIEDDFNFPPSSPNSTPTTKSRFLQNPASPGTATKVFPTSSLSAASVFDPHLEDMYPFSYGSPSRNTAFDMDLMPEWNFDQFVHA